MVLLFCYFTCGAVGGCRKFLLGAEAATVPRKEAPPPYPDRTVPRQKALPQAPTRKLHRSPARRTASFSHSPLAGRTAAVPPHASAAVPARPSAADWVGGYTVAGTKLSLRPGTAPGPPESFRVPQECLCSATATEHGIFARGANPGNAFLLLATRSDAGEWTAEQTSVGAAPPYTATMRFGNTAGGAHTAVGSTLNSRGVTTAFSAEQSAIGCHEGEGAAACETVWV